MTTQSPAVEVGQVWQDRDKRSPGRTVRVVEIDCRHAYVETLTRADGSRAPRRKPVRVLLHRFGSGFTLVEGVGCQGRVNQRTVQGETIE
ncbi:hypothetical protein [Gordonia sihwensis]|uniref:hypothetical protein n=1 Tax=Gordonia sihwensis TaxID=173559 RepID=UPI0005EF9E42|nr:hypothetical protein [Gordonia sihwensis]KJR10589.1 hypothetical protein UG54_00955 [Gordonia sihwensis]